MTAPTTTQPQRRQLSNQQLATILALVMAHAALRRRYVQAAIAGAVAPFRLLEDWWSADAINKAIAEALKVVQPLQLQAARATDAYMARAQTLVGGRAVRTVGAIDVTQIRRTITEEIAKDLVDGHRVPAWLPLGDTVNRSAPTINDPIHLSTDVRLPTPATSLKEARQALIDARTAVAQAQMEAQKLTNDAKQAEAAAAKQLRAEAAKAREEARKQLDEARQRLEKERIAAARKVQREAVRVPATTGGLTDEIQQRAQAARLKLEEARRNALSANAQAKQLRRQAEKQKTAVQRLQTRTEATRLQQAAEQEVKAARSAVAASSTTSKPKGVVARLKPEDAYGRVADHYRYQVVAQGVPEDKARADALVRIATIADEDIMLAVREQYHANLGQSKAEGYRRVLHPEFSEHGPCGLCVVAADRLYHKEDLLPLHPACRCTVMPVLSGLDPGVKLNQDDFAKLYGAAGGTAAEGLRQIRVVLGEHGELGPVLLDGDRHYRDPAEVAFTKADKRTRDQANLDFLERELALTEYRAERGDKVDKSLKWQRDRVAQLKRTLGE